MRIPATAVALAAVLGVGVATAQTAPATEDLEQRVRILERKLELADEEKATKAKESTNASAGEKGFGFKNADGSFEFKFKGLLHADGRFFADDDQAFNDTFLLRRVEPSFELTLGKLAFFRLQPQFSGDTASTADAYGELRFAPAFGLRFGKFKAPFGLENLQSSGALAFIERGLPTELGAGRDLGLQFQGELLGGTTSYALAWINGGPDGRDSAATDTDNKKELAARLFFEPFKSDPGFFQNLGFGIAHTTGDKFTTTTTAGTSAANATAAFNNALPRYRSPGQNTIFSYRSNAAPTDANTVIASGEHTRLAPQLFFYRGSFGLLGEHVSSEQDVSIGGVEESLEHQASQVVASYVLTGEDAGYKGVKPATPYAADGGWGALEIALRYAEADFDDDAFPLYANPDSAVSEITDLGLALNWYLTSNARLALNYDKSTFDGGAALGADRNDETAVFTRLQLTF